MKLLGAQDLADIRKRWENDIGIAARDVIRVLDHADVLLDVARHHGEREAIMHRTLTETQARCTELFEENRRLREAKTSKRWVCGSCGREYPESPVIRLPCACGSHDVQAR